VLPHSYGVSSWLDPPAGAQPLHVGVAGVVLTTVIALAGVAAVALVHLRRPNDDPVAVLGRLRVPLARAFWVDDVYDRVVVRPTFRLARIVVGVDRHGVDATVVGTGRTATTVASGLRRLQNGNVQSYASALIVLVVVVVVSVSLAVAR
jgi:NADH-quinone oxidoreductase subunit L